MFVRLVDAGWMPSLTVARKEHTLSEIIELNIMLDERQEYLDDLRLDAEA